MISYDTSIADYHAHKSISWSKIHDFLGMYPADYYDKYLSGKPQEREDKEAFDIGHAVEALVSGGENAFNELCRVSAWDSFKTKESRLWRDNQRELGLIPLTQENAELCRKMANAVASNPDAMTLIQASAQQVTFRTQVSGISLQCRSDFFSKDGATFTDGRKICKFDCDLKTVDSLSPSAFRDFESSSWNLGYHIARAFYRWVIRRALAEESNVSEKELPFPESWMIAVSKDENPKCIVYEVPEELLEIGERQLLGDGEQFGALQKIISCYKSNHWPSCPSRTVLQKPKWAK